NNEVMPVALHRPFAGEDSAPVQRKLWTREECGFLVKSGVLDTRRYELLEGELIERMSKNYPHMRAVMLLCRWLNRIFAEGRVLQEPSIHLTAQDTPYSDPEPDAVVLNRPFDLFAGKALPADIVLLVEVSDTSLGLDATRKAALYARAGIQDFWILDINGRRIIVHRDPVGDAFRSITAFNEDEPVTSLAAPEHSVRAADLF
ncbi:MAG: Uma2 family endonuclease, partial [Acidobacteriota bacterium]|nr:Uma2 family endonuclease [Acidobacteriota bacterium]